MAWMLYGATGFTGKLIAEEAVRRGHRPLLAGRSEEKLRPLAERLSLPHRALALDDSHALRRSLEGLELVLHAAGPFVQTGEPMLRACLDARASYLDITGELAVFEHTFSHGPEAESRGVALISGVGMDVVPTDCLARYVAEKLPGAQELELALHAPTRPTPGTAQSALGILAGGIWVRREGQLRPWPAGRGLKKVRFPDQERWVAPVPLGDLLTAYRTTRIPNITTYGAIPERLAQLLRFGWPPLALVFPLAARVLRSGPVQRRAALLFERKLRGPGEQWRKEGRCLAWARASDGRREAEAVLEVREAYAFTALSCVRAVEETLRLRPVGATTPALAFGADFVLSIEGSRRVG